MKNYQNNEWAIEKYGLEECKRRDTYYEDLERRSEILKQKAIERIDELYNLLKDYTGLDVEFTSTIKKDYKNEEYISIESEDFSSKYPFMKAAWSKMYIGTSNSDIYHSLNKEGDYDTETDFSKPCDTVGLWLSISYKYINRNGGSNSCEICSVRMDDKNDYHWMIRTN